MAGTLTAIHIYPVKSCRAVPLDSVEIASTGLQGDRLFQVIDAAHNPVTQRQQPTLATVQPTFNDGALQLEADGRAALHVPIPTVNDATANSLLGVPVAAADAGDEAAAWFTELLDAPVRLAAMTQETTYRLPIPGIDMTLSWADACSVLVVNRASLEWLNERSSEPFGMDRFRPNLTVDAGAAWTEDTWRDFSIGPARFGLGIAWPRCTIPQVDQVDGSLHKEPANVLKQHRWCSDAASADPALRPLIEGNALFGIGCSAAPEGAVVSLGDDLTVHRQEAPVITG